MGFSLNNKINLFTNFYSQKISVLFTIEEDGIGLDLGLDLGLDFEGEYSDVIIVKSSKKINIYFDHSRNNITFYKETKC